jgi:methionyl-tRNA formyltransferase|tara:strand:- start:172 stop:876 length:705 start_codon:yes stop_codon:yes gene_type:complete
MKSNYRSEIDNLGVVLLMGRSSCFYSKKIRKLLEKMSKKLYYCESNKIGEKIHKKYLKLNYDYIFCFRSFYILKNNILKKVNKAAINFHPGPPEYRGTGCVNYALYENSKFYGCTCHLINEKVDNGKIIDIKIFNINKKNSISEVLTKTNKIMFGLAISTIKNIKKNSDFIENKILKNKNIKWSNKIKKLKDLKNFYQINKNIKKNDFLNKIRATDYPEFKPYIKLYGKKFILE